MIHPFLVTNYLFGYIDGTILCPPSRTAATTDTASMDNPSYSNWVANDAHVRMLLISTVSEASFQHVQGLTSRDLWLSLERAYAPHISSREYTLKTQLLKLEMKGDETSSGYLTRAQEYATVLANIGEPFKDKDLAMLAVAGLREEYTGLKQNLLARSPPVTFNELYGLLSDHDYMITRHTTAVPQAFTAAFAGPAPTPSCNPQNSQFAAVQQMAAQLGYQLSPQIQQTSQSQAFMASRSLNNNRGNSRGTYPGNYNRNRDDSSGTGGQNRQPSFAWASTQNTVYGHCNRCGIGHIPAQCPNKSGSPSTSGLSQQSYVADYAAFSSIGSPYGSTDWKPDTGANGHATPDLTNLDHSEAYNGSHSLHVGDGNPLPIFHVGSSKIYSPNKTFKLSNVLHVPALKKNLLSVQQFCLDNDVFFEFHSSFFVVKDESTRTILLTGPSDQGLYTLRLPQLKSLPYVSFTSTKASSTIWHHRLGHPHARVFNSIISSNSLPLSSHLCHNLCSSCQMGKSSKLSLNLSNFRSNNILDLVYYDVWGPAPSLSFDGHKFFMLCVDHHSRYMWFYPLAQKSDVYLTFKSFVLMVERQFNTKLKNVQTDWGGEFCNLAPFFSSLGIIHRRSCPHTSEQNGIIERRNRHVVETGLALLAHSNTPTRFWSFAFETAVFLINRLPSRSNSNKSPFEHVFKRPPDYSFLRVFRCECFPYLRPYNRHKMDFRSTPCVFLGYSPLHHGYQCLDLDTERVYIAHHVRFNETHFPFQPKIPRPTTEPTPPYYSTFPDIPGTIPTVETTLTADTTPTATPTPIATTTPTVATAPTVTPIELVSSPTSQPPSPPPHPRPSNLRQNPKPTTRYDPSAYHTSTHPSEPLEPSSFTVANRSPKWRQAMAEEFDALVKNGTWSLVPQVPNTNIIDSKWVYRIKKDANGQVTRYKARLVAKGFNQKSGIDYQETFSPVVKATTIQVLLSLAVTNQWPLRQLDVQNAFLHGDLKETVYLRQPQGFVDTSRPDHVCLLHKSLYGLKQAPRAWFERFSTTLHHLGFIGSKTDPSLFILKKPGTLVYVLVYVDDIIVTGNNPAAITDIISKLGTAFAVKDLGTLHYFLGIEIITTGKNLILSQQKYICDLISTAGLAECKPVPFPMSSSQSLAIADSPLLVDPTKYRQTVGALQ
ncbi:putative RNA-directed DNA polymerase [Helianthus annuus]|nr:putative RNA-directed DNA polymerase [Helianthus annuus]